MKCALFFGKPKSIFYYFYFLMSTPAGKGSYDFKRVLSRGVFVQVNSVLKLNETPHGPGQWTTSVDQALFLKPNLLKRFFFLSNCWGSTGLHDYMKFVCLSHFLLGFFFPPILLE